jgi:D-alanine-D-alanine ligase
VISVTKIKLGLLYGGKSAEHQVSLQTALAAIKALNQDKFEIHPIYITEQGQWVRGERIEGEVTDVEALKMNGAENVISPLSLSTEIIPSAASEENAIDVIFPLLHGPNGEDGTVQG